MAGLAESLFPRSSRLGHLSGYHPRALLGAGLDVASLPGRAYASLGRMSDESYLDALGRTGPRYVVGQGEGDEMADAILRDPWTPVGFGVGAAIKGLRPILGLGADLGINAAGMAADQYASLGTVNPGEIGAGAGMGALLGLGGLAKGGGKYVSHPTFRKYGIDPEKGATLYHGSPREFDKFDLSKAGSQRAMTEGWGAYFTADKNNAKAFGRNIIDLNLSADDLQRVIDLEAPMSAQTPFIRDALSGLSQAIPDPDDAMMRIQTMARDPMYKSYFSGDIGKSLWDYEKMRNLILSDEYINTPVGRAIKGNFLPQDIRGATLVKRAEGSMSGSSKRGNIWLNDYGVIGYSMPSHSDILAKNKNTANAVIFDNEILSRINHQGSSASRNRATTRLERQAAQVAYDKYGRPREESAARPVSAFQGLGSLLSSPSDTYYTRGAR